jgi:hypothetical protein
MTLDELLTWAREHVRDVFGEPNPVALAIINLLGEAQPCGFPEPVVVMGTSGGRVVDVHGDGSAYYEPDELRAMCAMWLRAADEAEKTPS